MRRYLLLKPSGLMLWLIFFSLIPTTHLFATHIVGGEMELTHLENNRYRIGLLLYFDEINGQQGAKDQSVSIAIFRKSDNSRIRNYILYQREVVPVNYTVPECAIGSLKTSKVYYAGEFFLAPNDFSDPEGYYMAFERCCRNDIIENILRPEDAGQTFYLEFPPLIKDGAPFINSSPKLFPPLSDYACINQPFIFDFSGEDADNDSLSYAIATPINGFSTPDDPAPNPRPGPYSTVEFLPTYGLDSMIKGSPPLNIDAKTGILSLTPSELGLFVFSVKCEEFRNGEKIGEVVRDFQMLVVDCPIPNAPTVMAQNSDGTLFNNVDTLIYEVGKGDACIEVFVTDPDPQTRVYTRVIPKNFKTNELEILGDLQRMINPGDTAKLQLCIKDCPDIRNEIYEVEVLVGDNTCSLPLVDTFRLVFDIREPNTPPELKSEDLSFNNELKVYETTLILGDTLDFKMLGLDEDMDSVVMKAIGDGFDFGTEGMQLNNVSGIAPVEAGFSWVPTCANMGPGIEEKSFEIDFLLQDYGACGIKSTDTARVKINLVHIPEPNKVPQVSADGLSFDGKLSAYCDTVIVGDLYKLNIRGFDPDGDSITLTGFGSDFNFLEKGMVFGNVSGFGEVTSEFMWQTSCSDIQGVNEGVNMQTLELFFVSSDYNDCYAITADTVKLKLKLIFVPDPAKAPVLSINGAKYDHEALIYTETIEAGQDISLDIFGRDFGSDELDVTISGMGFNLADLGMTTQNVTGKSPVKSEFYWITDCSMLNDSAATEFTLQIIARNSQKCGLEAADTALLKLKVIDPLREDLEAFPNAFTPNGDGKSDTYYITELPKDTCKDRFEFVEISNRWGDIIFNSEERNFQWDGVGHPQGVYYYVIKFTESIYKGTISLVGPNTN
ncbi:gliding motility-associated C-terminal domain-containing protein [Flexithrix dorotheae]|uniref:T9SS type B sorting domain-containing protein n=1 Tax=Flexithrix dorotheae TaxID=70993 RepID=UPI00039A03E0|nr:gliding motility-associated C-terminal domain-containing protein [Flexithrix dorotheae]